MMKRQFMILAFTALAVVALFSVELTAPAPVLAQDVPYISGLGEYDDGTCGTESPNGQTADYGYKLSGDLTGCLYGFVDSVECGPGGIYIEKGVETFVGEYNGESGTFWTTYVFLAKFESCADGVVEGQISGGCHHPLIPGSGTGAFDGARGQLVFIDDVEAGNFPYMGSLDFPDDAAETEGDAGSED